MTAGEVKTKLTDIINKYELNTKRTLSELEQLRTQLRQSGAQPNHPGIGPINFMQRYVSEGLIEVNKGRTGLI